VNRRALITLLGGAAVWPMAARGQQGERMRRIGVLMNAAATETVPQAYVAAFAQGLRQLGWTEGQNLRVDVRWNAGDAQLARIYAAQLIGLMPDAILTASTTSLTIIQQATSTVPVVFVQVSDPVEQGFVSNAAKPGGNLTGFSLFEFSIGVNGSICSRRLRPNSPTSVSCSTPTPHRSRNSSCDRSRPQHRPSAYAQRRFPFAPLTTSSPPSRASRSNRTVG
jgi:ABC transporter substrate binding protein